MTLKGINEINDIINDFLEPFELTADWGTDFCYIYTENKIEYSLAVSNVGSQLFIKNAEARFPNVHADIFLWSLLHEVGHHETIDDLDNMENLLSVATKDEIAVHKEEWSTEKCNEIYFTCPDEIAATNWAGEYITKHAEELTVFWDKLRIAIHEFYKNNKLTDL